MANPAYDVTKITDNEIKINPRWRTANILSQNISRNNKVTQNR
jgi:hypothetical protein